MKKKQFLFGLLEIIMEYWEQMELQLRHLIQVFYLDLATIFLN